MLFRSRRDPALLQRLLDRALIEQALKKRGITPSDEKILDLYTQKVSR